MSKKPTSNTWMRRDGSTHTHALTQCQITTTDIITSPDTCLGAVPHGLLPSSNIATRTALSIYRTLAQYYGTCSFADCADLMNSLHSSLCTSGRVQEYVSKWRASISRLQSAQFPFSVKKFINQFMRGLPLIAAFTSLQADLPNHIAMVTDHDYGAFISLTEAVLELDTIFRASSQAQASRVNHHSHAPSTATVTAQAPTSQEALGLTTATTATTNTTSKSSLLYCTNCKRTGHLVPTCFQPGGGMAGHCNEYMANRDRVRAFFSEMLDDAADNYDIALDFSAPSTPPSPAVPEVLEQAPPMLDDQIVQPMAAMSFNLHMMISNLRYDLYNQAIFKFPKFRFFKLSRLYPLRFFFHARSF
jgi:hypothetical protein